MEMLASESILQKKSISTPTVPKPLGPYSEAIQFSKTVYIAGQIPIDPKSGELVKGNFKSQFKQALTNISEITKASGGDLNDILKLTIYLTNLNDFNAVNDVMKENFREPYPARVVVKVSELPMHAPVEIDAIMSLSK
jgi:reactive intermediate/imine deaminase